MKTTFHDALAFTLRREGGKVDDPDDLGGRTAYGVTQQTYDRWRRSRNLPTRDVWEITHPEVEAIYQLMFWRPVADVPAQLRVAAFDFAVHSGPRRARDNLPPDQQLATYLANRLAWFDDIVRRKPAQRKFLKGWRRRVELLRTYLAA